MLSSRLQITHYLPLQFCEKVTELRTCPAVESAMMVSHQRQGGEAMEPTTEALCRCAWPAYWQLHRLYYRDYLNGTVINVNYFRCAKVRGESTFGSW